MIILVGTEMWHGEWNGWVGGVDGGRDYVLAWWDYVSWIILSMGFFLL